MHANDMTKEIFVFEVTRSGGNLIARLLDTHSQIGVTLDPLLPVFSNWVRDTALQSEE